ncbi:hypothetical protein KIN20_026942 [Parelaphostrongylus tenuis]|uniref:Uncharacterized protein n=1 Tax=Parelaphostrongylus tenuis TaxID=148309 RepID=A0AAD5QYW6_PARTN|nr:hypothetical protein KIN20_026942 [Parelaphostrongylus tenuis]
MVYTETLDVFVRVPGIATSKKGAQDFVQRLVMQTVFDALERQARNALLPDGVISTILNQLTVSIIYEPLHCKNVILSRTEKFDLEPPHCLISNNKVVGSCSERSIVAKRCVKFVQVPNEHLSFSGTLLTTNIVMANWSREMWQSVVDRALQMLISGPYGSNFLRATSTVNGN